MWLLQLGSIRKQRSDQMFKSSRQKSPDNTSVDTLEVESEFAVRNVTELIVDDGYQADKGRKMRLNDIGGYKFSFIEL